MYIIVFVDVEHSKSGYPNVIARIDHESKGPELSNAKYDTVRPLANTKEPKGLYMLSNIDHTIPFPFDMLFAFQTNNSLINVDVGQILKQSLSKALEVYYPFAGRVKMGFDGKIVVDCDSEGGVPFVEVFSDEDMAAAIGDITAIDRNLAKKLVYNNRTPYETVLDVPPLEIQVNRFRCGGMILGLRFNHLMCDGSGLLGFMRSWSEIARDVPLSIKPHLDRSILSPRNPPKIDFRHPEFSRLGRSLIVPFPNNREKIIIKKSFIFTPTRLRELGMQNNNKNEAVSRAPPTTFEVMSALTWICWAKSKKLGPDETSRIGISVDCRLMLKPRIPKGYFGNCLILPCAQSRARDLTSQPLSYAIQTVHAAIKQVTGDYVKSTIDFVESTRKPLNADNTVQTIKWTRLPIHEIDFGWGTASQVTPGATMDNYVFFLPQFYQKDNKNLVLSATLSVDAMEVFQDLITSEFKDDL